MGIFFYQKKSTGEEKSDDFSKSEYLLFLQHEIKIAFT